MINKKLLIGSRALNWWFNDVPIYLDTDWDIVSETPYECERFEWHKYDFLNNNELIRYTDDNDFLILNDEKIFIVNPIGLSLVKRSHLHRGELNFGKHITHYHKYLSVFSREYTEEDKKFLKDRIRLTNEYFPQWHPNLNQSVDTFFVDAVKKKYHHDDLHVLFAYEEVPLYTKLQKDSSKAWCCEDLWYNLSYTQKIQCVAEEVQVIAAERYIIPANYDYNFRIAYNRALEKVCTTLCSGWFRDFAIDNYPDILSLYDKNRISCVLGNVKNLKEIENE